MHPFGCHRLADLLGSLLKLGHHPLPDVRHGAAREEDVHPDSLLGVLQGRRLGELDDPPFEAQ